MATRQSLKGSNSKIYEIVNTFNKGYNTSVADDLLAENVFRDISNFLPSTEGNITKRPGINRTRMYDLFNKLLTYTDANFTLNVNGTTNEPNVGSSTLTNIKYLYENLFEMKNYNYTRSETIGVSKSTSASFTPENLSNFTILDDSGILDYIKKFDELLNYAESDYLYENKGFLDFIAIFYGPYKETYIDGRSKILLDTHAIRIMKVSISLEKSDNKHVMNINYELRQPYRSTKDNRLTFRYEGDYIIDFAIYADNYYFMNGYDALLKISRSISLDNSDESIVEIYKDSPNIYKPTAIEVSNIGFNILSNKPLEHIDIQGTAVSIRGVFYTYNGEPTKVIPYNKEFKIHVLSSGTGTMAKPQYRFDNGEVDVEKNPYKDLNGAFNTEGTIFTCTGLDEVANIELKFKKGDVEFFTYVKMGSVETNDLGKIADISDLILSSRYCKNINNQLVLFGNHGYLFFSEYDNFNYFPNYNNIYVAETENEYAVSINYFRQYYAIFTNKRIKRMTGAFGSDNFGIYPLNDFIGCVNPKTIRQIQNYIYFLSYNGIYMLKQGYLGEGTENVEQVDLSIFNSYNPNTMVKGYTIQNYYALYSKNEAILYNFTNQAFYKLKASDVDEESTSTLNINETRYSIPFQYNKLQSKLFYGIRVRYKESNSYKILFDFCSQDFTEEETERTDNELTFVSTLETPAMSLGSPTNTKKFKEIYLKIYNSYGKNIPLYVTIKVDDKIVVSPRNYTIEYDEKTSTYSYVEKVASNKELKGYNVLGTMEIGEDPLGERTMQILKMRVGDKGRSIKVILSDGLSQGEDGYSPHQNMYRFDLATLGIVYKLKKVKEG